MTLGEARKYLAAMGVQQVGSKKLTEFGRPMVTTLYFTRDAAAVFPFRLKTIGVLVLASSEESQRVNSEQYKALLRQLGFEDN